MNLFATFEKMSISDEKFKKFTMYYYTITMYYNYVYKLFFVGICILMPGKKVLKNLGWMECSFEDNSKIYFFGLHLYPSQIADG